MLGVEKCEVDVEPGEEAGLDDAKEQAHGNETAVGFDKASHGGDDAPGDGDEGDPAARGEELEDQVGGHLEDEVGDEEDGYADLELAGGEAEILLEAIEAGVANVDSGVSLSGSYVPCPKVRGRN